ncbi:MAG: hypothetical protein COU10_00065 [Candidatus Harrisonbacteria bacterium CG10_big_fil_rev_8_21_14_0_10_45_28]|uniref:Membrane fusion protein biotin-lipoyl like domain-containing protein n=1 Tax=Candidatus Harrisonbacteria bacterium CG10_big_fil_rev_8_21_14_0_10_45_28 TaxID=1974586 RepID=A0A2H0UPD1_9BACT|nr:MAG: hypothetical protein COU10_00065 [Candidatus Harrisonbacteria bacterium CG10_big_fil_rev_8_21_14_0_10_45_28]
MNKKSSKKKYVIWGTVIVSIIIVALFFIFNKKEVTYSTEEVTLGNVSQTISVTGQIKSKNSATLRFKISGIIDKLYANIGDIIYKGELLATISTQDLERKLAQARADLGSAEVAVENATQSVADTKTENNQSVSTIYTDAPVTLAQILNNAQKAHASLSGFYNYSGEILSAIEQSTPNYQLIINSKTAKVNADAAILSISMELTNFPANASTEDIDQVLSAINAPIQSLQNALSALISNINGIKTGLQVSASTLETYKATLATAQTNLNTAIADEIGLRADLNDILINNQLDLNTAESNYRLKVAQLASAQAAVATARQNLDDAYMRSPIKGIVATKNKEIGELVTVSDVVYKIIDGDDIEVVADIPEVDIGQIALGNSADGTLDALDPDEHFALNLVSIEPDQTMIDGVVHYKTRFEFESVDPRFKSGMSVNLDILVAQADDVITVSRRSITQRDGKSYLQIFKGPGQSPEEREVTIGLRGDQNAEVVSGLTVGEKIIIND